MNFPHLRKFFENRVFNAKGKEAASNAKAINVSRVQNENRSGKA